MITKSMIKKGLNKGTISIENEFGGCVGLCCRIGDNSFYFAGIEDSCLTIKEYLEKYTMNEVISMLYDVLKDIESAESNGIDCEEWEYYRSVIKK